jgi:hypothetical protein
LAQNKENCWNEWFNGNEFPKKNPIRCNEWDFIAVINIILSAKLFLKQLLMRL